MATRVEKLSLLSEMIAFAKVDNTLKPIEYNFLKGIAAQLDVTDADFNYLLNHPVNLAYPKTYSERIVQFHRLVLLMNLSDEIDDRKWVKIHNFGLRMGLSQESINKVLDLMDSFPDKIVPPDVLIDIFKVQYN